MMVSSFHQRSFHSAIYHLPTSSSFLKHLIASFSVSQTFSLTLSLSRTFLMACFQPSMQLPQHIDTHTLFCPFSHRSPPLCLPHTAHFTKVMIKLHLEDRNKKRLRKGGKPIWTAAFFSSNASRCMKKDATPFIYMDVRNVYKGSEEGNSHTT